MGYIKNTSLKLWSLVLIFSACQSTRLSRVDDGIIEITFVQMNDVYEIAPLEGGKSGGLARVAQLKQELLKKNPNTVMVIAGDFLSPSIFNSLKLNGERIRGRQMVDVLNAAGTDLAVFGNHEFDITEPELQSRLNESAFDWVSTNTFHNRNGSVSNFVKLRNGINEPLPEMIIRTFRDADGTEAKVGFIGITLPFNKASYVKYEDPLSSSIKMYNRLRDSCDAIVAITHQLVSDDSVLALTLPDLALIMGGHEHDMKNLKVGKVEITKAHANAKTVFINNLVINKKLKTHTVQSELKPVDEKIAFEPETRKRVDHWNRIANESFAGSGFNAERIVTHNLQPLDGREAEIRNRKTNFTRYIVQAMEKAAPMSDVAIVNSGSIRVDDILYMPVTEYDIIRSLPFGGGIVEVDMQGSLLKRILNASESNKGIGGYLHYSEKITNSNGNWMIRGKAIEDRAIYRVALTDFLLTGGEANMNFLKQDNPEIIKTYPSSTDQSDSRTDIRYAIIRFLQTL